MSRHRWETYGDAVVGQHPLHEDATFGEPGHGPVENPDRGGGGLVVVTLGVGDSGVVVDHGVDVAGPDPGVAVLGVAHCGSSGGPVAEALRDAHVAPSAAGRDVAEVGDVDVEQVPGPGPLVAAGRFPGDPVDVGQPVQAAADQDRVHRRGTVEAGIESLAPIWTGPSRCFHRR